MEGVGLGLVRRGERQEFTIVETVRRKVGGSVLLVEGRGTKKADKKEEVVVHEALAVVSYDGKARRYRWQSHDLRGGRSRWNRSWWTVASNGASGAKRAA